MSTTMVILVKFKDREKFKQYGAGAGDTIRAAGGEFVARLAVSEVLCGSVDADIVATVTFPDIETAKNWYHSADYQALIPLRDEGADVSLLLTQTPG